MEDPENEAGRSTRWFAYIAVGITLASMTVGLAVMARLVYWFFTRGN
jgi:hypothetical protein